MRGNIRAILFGIAITFPILIIILPLYPRQMRDLNIWQAMQ